MIAPTSAAPTTVVVDEAVTLRRYALAATVVALGVYLLTLAPDLSWDNAATDGGELITAAVTLGIPHPPGYPLYVVLGKVISLLPVGNVAWRFNLLSAVCGALAVGILVLAIGTYHRGRVRPAAAAAAGLLFGFTPLVWSQAVVAEVYTLNLLLLSIFLLVWSREGASGWAGFWLGLAITSHLTSLLILPALLIGQGRGRAVVGLGLGFAPLLLLPWLASGDSPVIWGQPDDLAGWWWLISGRLYAANLQLALDGERFLALLRAVAYGPAALIVARRTAATPLANGGDAWRQRLERLALPAIALGYGVFALLYDTTDSAVLLLPGLMITAVLVAPLLATLGRGALLIPAMLVLAAYPTQDLSSREPRALVEEIMATAPRNAILLAPGDRTIFSLWYFHHVEGQRPDIIVVDANLFAFDWYRERLARRYPAIAVPQADDLAAFQRHNALVRPFCTVGLVVPAPPTPAGQLSGNHSGGPPYLNCIEGVK